MSELQESGVWYCRVHCGIRNEDEPHERADDFCPWRDESQESYETDDDGVIHMDRVVDPCDWTPLLFRPAEP